MNFHFIDWGIVVGLVVLMTIAAYRTKKYTTSVADFLAANRCAGRYVLGVSIGIADIGAIGIIGMWEAYYRVGFTFEWWILTSQIIAFFLSLSGWVQYRFRQTRALTMAQFLEMRYSKRFRILAGITAFIAGTLNFGLFPAVGARFFMYFCGLRSYEIEVFGIGTLDLTYASVMICLLAIALYFTLTGGQIAVTVTDFIQGVFSNIFLVIVIVMLFTLFPWSHIIEVISQRPVGQSMLNPFDISDTEKFGMGYHLTAAFIAFWCWMAWISAQGYQSSARNAHEARMGLTLGAWRSYTSMLLIVIVPICAYVVLHDSNWANEAAGANEVLNSISNNPNDTIRSQLTTTVVLSKLLPIGLMGAFCAVMLAAFISTHDTYLHSWGSIFVQDVILPLRKNRLRPEQHLRLLRWSIFGVAVFVFVFALLFQQYDAILMFFALTSILWLGGAGTVIVFGLYWKRGTTAAAYGAMITGITGFLFSLTMQKLWPALHNGQEFPINSMWLRLYAVLASIVVYVLISLLSKKSEFNMDKLLHRGKYTIVEDATKVVDKPVRGWQSLFGMNEDFTFRDKIVYCSITGWTILWTIIFFSALVYKAVFDINVEGWAKFWHFYMWMALVLGIGTTIWFTIGGLIDLKKMFGRLATLERDETDDGEILAEQDSADNKMVLDK